MKTEHQIATRNEIMHYIAVRLLNHKRIDKPLFNELLCERFGIINAESLFNEFLEKGAARLCGDVIMSDDKEVLQQYLQPQAQQQEQLSEQMFS